MIGQPMPQDILKYEAKFALGLTTRKCIWYGIGVVGALCGFFVIGPALNFSMTLKIIIGVVFCIPFFLWGAIKPFGENPEKVIVPFILDNLIAPSIRKKEVHDFDYEKNIKMEKLSKKEKKKQINLEKKSEYKSII